MFTKSSYHKRIVTKRLLPAHPGSATVTDRQELLAGFDQSALERAKIVVIGAGGIGSEVGEGLVRKGAGHVMFLDPDFVELSNLNRQHFFAADLHKPKAPQLAKNLAAHAVCGTVLEGYGVSFQDALALRVTLTTDVVICGVDNNSTRVAVSEYCHRQRIPGVFIAVDLVAENGYVFVQEPDKACFVCAFPSSLTPRKLPCRTPAVKDILKVVAGLALYATDSLLMDRKRNWNYRNVRLAAFAASVEKVIPRRTECPICGPTSKERSEHGVQKFRQTVSEMGEQK